jgi:iron complex outermembrane recepter protein
MNAHPGTLTMIFLMALLFSGSVAAQQDAGDETADERAQAKADAAAGDEGLDEIIVSAPRYVSTGSRSGSKSDVPLVEIPQSITVISRDQIDLLEWNTVQEATRYTAGVAGENFGPDIRYDWLTVRGFQPLQFIDGLQAPIGSVNNVGTDLYGSESLEILKGPSSVLYGQTPPGGIINMTSRRPQREYAGEVGAQYGSFDYWQVNGDYTGPINDVTSFRVTGLYRDSDTQTDFVNGERTYLAPALTFDFTERAQLTLLGYYQKDDIDNWAGGFLPAAGTLLPNPNGKIPVSRSLGEPGINRYYREQWGAGYDFKYAFDNGFTLEQNLKFFGADSEMTGTYGQGFTDANYDGIPDDYRTVNRADFPFDETIDSFGVDTRGYFDFNTGSAVHSILVGLDYRKYDAESFFGFASSTFPAGSVPTLDIFNPVYGVPFVEPEAIYSYTDLVQKQTGLYVQDQIAIDKLYLTLSGRQDWVDNDDRGTTFKDNEFTYRAGLNYVFDSGWAPYVQAASSFQPITGAADFAGQPFAPTTGDQYEAGLKYDGRNLSPDVKIFAAAAIYSLKQKNVLIPDPDHLFFSIQAGEVEVQGMELEVITRIRERWSFNLSYTYTDSDVDNTGKQLSAVAKNKFSALANYTFQDGALAGFGAGFGARYLSGVYGDAANLWKVPGVTLFDAVLSYDTADWRFGVSASNLFDKEYVARCSSSVDCFYGTVRSIIGSVTRKF